MIKVLENFLFEKDWCELNEYSLDIHTCIGGWFIPKSLCDDIIEYFNLNKHLQYKGVTSNNINKKITIEANSDIKDSIDMMIKKDDIFQPFGSYRFLLQKCLENYLKKYNDANSNKAFNINESYNIQYYKPNDGYKIWHFENANRTDRLFAFMTYLNDNEDGGTEFKYQNLTTPAKKGLTLIWPANWTHTHRGQISKTKEKYIVTGWYSINEYQKVNNEI